ncbi:MAG: hypothetical protein H0W62_03375 [Chitinophagales bacterium]|nr:hypothetical protein [Chitinophagales bacterium]
MKKLSSDWLTQGTIDFEYKKYILLAYLQEVSRDFDEKKLYPVLSDLVLHYNNLVTIKKNKTYTSQLFPKHITKMDLENFKIEFEKLIADEDYLKEVESIIDFAVPRIHHFLENGKEIYQSVEENLMIFPVGIVSLNPENGYMMLTQSKSSDTQVYSYEITLFENVTEKFRGIKTQFIGHYSRSISNTFESIKFQLIREFKNSTNPAAFVIESKNVYPLNETLLPVAKRSLVRYIYTIAA